AVLRVRTDPPGATLYLDRKDLGARGQSPSVLAFAPGKYKVLAELSGYQPAWSQEVDAAMGSDTQVDLKLVRILRPLRFEGTPAGALVKLDSGESCVLPCELQLPPGKNALDVEAPGYARKHKD